MTISIVSSSPSALTLFLLAASGGISTKSSNEVHAFAGVGYPTNNNRPFVSRAPPSVAHHDVVANPTTILMMSSITPSPSSPSSSPEPSYGKNFWIDAFQSLRDDKENDKRSSSPSVGDDYNTQEVKLGIAMDLDELSKEARLEINTATIDKITKIVQSGVNELNMLSERLQRENANPYNIDRLKWDRNYQKDEQGLRDKIQRLSFNFLQETASQRKAVKDEAFEQSIQKEYFAKKAEAASHGQKYPIVESAGAKLLRRARKALDGLLPNQGGTWNEWDEWTPADENDDDSYDNVGYVRRYD